MAGLGLGLVAAAARAGGIAAGGIAPPLRGWDPVFDAGTQADTVLAPGDDIQAAVDAAHAGGQPATIALRGGTYRQSVLLPDGASGLTLKRYGAERPVLTGAEPLTGWTQASAADADMLGAGYAEVWRTTLPAASIPHGTPRLLNLHHAGARRALAQDRAGYVDPLTGLDDPVDRFYLAFDGAFHETGLTYTYDGSGVITAVTSQPIFGAYTQAQLEADGVLIGVYCGANNVILAEITGYDPATHTAQVLPVGGATAGFDRAANDREAISLINLPAALAPGEWAALRDGSDVTVYYRPLPGEAPGLDTAMEVSIRPLGIDIGACSDVALIGLDVVQFENDEGQSATCVGSGTPARRAAAKTNLFVSHCRLARTSGSDYGAMLAAGCTGLRIERLTLEDIDRYGAFLYDSADTHVTGVHAQRCGQSGLRVYSTVKGLFADMIFEENGRGGHANQLNFYEGCDEIAVAFLETRGCYGYVTHQEASRVTYYMSRIQANRDEGGSGRAIVDQQRGANAGQGGPDGSGARVADSDFRYICLDLPPYGASDPNALRVGGGTGTAERAIILNNVTHGGGNIDVYTNGFDPSLEVRDGNIYTALAFWQAEGSGWVPGAGESVVDPAGVYVDFAGNDLRHRGGSPVRGAVGVDITPHVQALEALWPDVNFRRDLAGAAIDPAAPPVGALVYRGPVPLTSPAPMAVPLLDAVTTEGLDATLAAAPRDNGAPITSYDLRYRQGIGAWTERIGVASTTSLTGLTGGVLVEVQTRAVNAQGAAAWSEAATLSTVSAGLPDGIISDPGFLDPNVWDTLSRPGTFIGDGLTVDGTNPDFSGCNTASGSYFPITPGQAYELTVDISEVSAEGRLRFRVDYYKGTSSSDGKASVTSSGNIPSSTVSFTEPGILGPYAVSVVAPADATHAQFRISLFDGDARFTLRKVSLVAV